MGEHALAVSPATILPDGWCGSSAVASAAWSTSARPLSQGEGETGRASTSLQQFARSLGLANGGKTWSYDDLLDRCVNAYWQNRPVFGPRCGSVDGYRDHLRRRQTACRACRTAYATYTAIYRLRRARGIPGPGRQLRPCGTHAAYVRHKAHGEQPCPACEAGERQYHHDYTQQRRAA